MQITKCTVNLCKQPEMSLHNNKKYRIHLDLFCVKGLENAISIWKTGQLSNDIFSLAR